MRRLLPLVLVLLSSGILTGCLALAAGAGAGGGVVAGEEMSHKNDHPAASSEPAP